VGATKLQSDEKLQLISPCAPGNLAYFKLEGTHGVALHEKFNWMDNTFGYTIVFGEACKITWHSRRNRLLFSIFKKTGETHLRFFVSFDSFYIFVTPSCLIKITTHLPDRKCPQPNEMLQLLERLLTHFYNNLLSNLMFSFDYCSLVIKKRKPILVVLMNVLIAVDIVKACCKHIIGLDSIYKLNKDKFPTWALIAGDELGHGHPIALAIGSCGSAKLIAKFLQVAKEKLGQELNEQWVPTIIIDHDEAAVVLSQSGSVKAGMPTLSSPLQA